MKTEAEVAVTIETKRGKPVIRYRAAETKAAHRAIFVMDLCASFHLQIGLVIGRSSEAALRPESLGPAGANPCSCAALD